MEDQTVSQTKSSLWTRDFIILTLGTVVSMLGCSLAFFAMDLMVLDYTGSTLLFAIYSMVFMLPNALSPVLAGPLLDRFSRKKTIYALDFLSAGIFAVVAVVLKTGHFSFFLLASVNFLLGGINGIYGVAYDSFYPLLISEGNFQKAYSVASTLETLSAVMIPISAFIYNTFGIVPLIAANAIAFFIAAVMETQIKAEEKYISRTDDKEEKSRGLRRFTADFREGLDYLAVEKGLLAVTLYFTVSALVNGMTGVVTLPYFRKTFSNGEYVYMLVWGMCSLARFIGGLIHYSLKLPVQWKFSIALFVYITISVLEGGYLFVPVPLMMVATFLNGILGITSYNIRASSTQQYVPDEKKGRFNGTFGTLCTVGTLAGQGLAGVMSEFIGERAIVVIANALCIAAAVIIGGSAGEVSKIYNREV